MILHHLQAMFDGPQPVVGVAQGGRILPLHDLRGGQSVQRRLRAARAQRRVAPAMDQLVGVGKEFHLANAAAALFHIVIRPRRQRPLIGRADFGGQLPDLGNGSEVQAAPPYEWGDRLKKIPPFAPIPGRRARPDIGGPFPGQRRGFVMHKRGIERQGQRADLRCRPQTQIDAEDVTFGGVVGQQLDDVAGVTLRRLARFVAVPAGQGRGIVEQDGIDVGTVIQLPRAMFAQCDRRQAGGLRIRHALRDGRADRPVQRAIGELRQDAHDRIHRNRPRQIGHTECCRQGQPFTPQPRARIRRALPRLRRPFHRLPSVAFAQQGVEFGLVIERPCQERRMRAGASQRVRPVAVSPIAIVNPGESHVVAHAISLAAMRRLCNGGGIATSAISGKRP